MEVWLLLGMTQPGRLGRNSKLETGHGVGFRVSSFKFRFFPSHNATIRKEDGRNKKNYGQTRQVIENKG